MVCSCMSWLFGIFALSSSTVPLSHFPTPHLPLPTLLRPALQSLSVSTVIIPYTQQFLTPSCISPISVQSQADKSKARQRSLCSSMSMQYLFIPFVVHASCVVSRAECYVIESCLTLSYIVSPVVSDLFFFTNACLLHDYCHSLLNINEPSILYLTSLVWWFLREGNFSKPSILYFYPPIFPNFDTQSPWTTQLITQYGYYLILINHYHLTWMVCLEVVSKLTWW